MIAMLADYLLSARTKKTAAPILRERYAANMMVACDFYDDSVTIPGT